MSLISTKQINQTELTLFVQQAASGSAFSGNFVAFVSASGYIGTNALWTTGGAQSVAGAKTFLSPITVPYSGNTGQSVARLYVDDQVTSLSGFFTGGFVSVTNSQSIQGTKTFDSPTVVASPSATGHAVNLGYLTGVSGVSQANLVSASGALRSFVNGNVSAYNIVTTTGNELIGGFKQFTGSPLVPAPTLGSGVVNLDYLTGALTNGSGALRGSVDALSGILKGNCTQISFFSSTVASGLNLFEQFTVRDFYFTGSVFSCRSSGTGPINGGVLSGKIYQVDSNNTEQTLHRFAFPNGTIYSGVFPFNILVTGGNRIGLSITNIPSGIQRFCVGVLGTQFV